MSIITYIFLKIRLKQIIFCSGCLSTAERRDKLYDFIDNYIILPLEQVHVLRNAKRIKFLYVYREKANKRLTITVMASPELALF